MPELPEVEAERRRLEPAMRGARITRVKLRRAGLRRPFPKSFASTIEGRRVTAVDRRGKYLIVVLDRGPSVLMHLGMTGSFRIVRGGRRSAKAAPGADTHDHVVFTLSNDVTVTFNDPRRFGAMDLVDEEGSRLPAALSSMGPEPLSPAFDASTLAAALTGKRVPLKVALLDQRVVAGLGNIYAGEALHVAGLSPRRAASTVATATGRPRPSAERLARAVKSVLEEAIARGEQAYRAGRFRVYDRSGEPCNTHGCHGRIRRIVQAGRSTFFCPVCQR